MFNLCMKMVRNPQISGGDTGKEGGGGEKDSARVPRRKQLMMKAPSYENARLPSSGNSSKPLSSNGMGGVESVKDCNR